MTTMSFGGYGFPPYGGFVCEICKSTSTGHACQHCYEKQHGAPLSATEGIELFVTLRRCASGHDAYDLMKKRGLSIVKVV